MEEDREKVVVVVVVVSGRGFAFTWEEKVEKKKIKEIILVLDERFFLQGMASLIQPG